jgi:hypothetical protein
VWLSICYDDEDLLTLANLASAAVQDPYVQAMPL